MKIMSWNMWKERFSYLWKNSLVVVKSKYKKGELKAKKILIDGLQYHLLVYVGSLKKYKDIYDKPIGMYEFKNLNHILFLKNKLK